MRFTCLLLASLLFGGCTLAAYTLSAIADSSSGQTPARQSRDPGRGLRTEKNLKEEAVSGAHTIGHVRMDLHAGAFTDSDLSDEYSGVWGIGLSAGFFVHDHISVGGLLDWSLAFGDSEREVSNHSKIDVDLTMEMITFAPMVWFHSTSPQTTTSRRPDFMIGLGPAVVWAEEEVSWGSWPFFESSEDESGVGYGFVAEALVEFPVSDRLTLSAGVRYTSAELDEFDVNGGTISGSAGIGFRF